MSARLDPRSLPSTSAQRFQVLALSGGGVRGLYAACVLEGLERRAGQPLHHAFDLLAGTSIGGIIAIGLALGRDAGDIRVILEDAAKELFPMGGRLVRKVRGLFRARYGSHTLRRVIQEVVGSDTRLGDLRHPLLVPAVALTAGAAQSFRTPHHFAHRHGADTRLADVALTTAAAPLLFPVARVANGEFLDGGLIANAPDSLALHEAEVFFARRRSDVFMLSVGTTANLAALAAGRNLSRGLLYWMGANRLVEITMSAQQELSFQLTREALGARHFTINAARSRQQSRALALDRADGAAIATLKAMARHSLDDVDEDPRLNQFLNHQAQPLVVS